jgi:hypothetical protein
MRRTVLATTAAIALACAGPASAAEVTGGSTSLKLSPGTAQALQSIGVSAKGTRYTITGGSVDPSSFAGTIRHRGSLTLSKGSTRVRLRNFTARIGKRSTLRSGSLTVGTLDLSDLKANGTTLSNIGLELSSAAAKALNRAFDVNAFKKGLELGTLTVRAKVAS